MSYDLAVWVGSRPRDDEQALETFETLADLADESDVPPTPRIRAFVDALLQRWPEDTDHGPWAVEPVLDDVGGDFLYLTMTYPGADEVVPEAARLAESMGLVCFDPQLEALLPEHGEELGDDGPPTADEIREVLEVLEGGVGRADAARLLRLTPDRLDRCAGRVGAGDDLFLADLLTVSVLAADDIHPEGRWLEAAVAVRHWWESGPDLDTAAFLVVDEVSAGVHTPAAGGPPPPPPTGVVGMYELTGALRELRARVLG